MHNFCVLTVMFVEIIRMKLDCFTGHVYSAESHLQIHFHSTFWVLYWLQTRWKCSLVFACTAGLNGVGSLNLLLVNFSISLFHYFSWWLVAFLWQRPYYFWKHLATYTGNKTSSRKFQCLACCFLWKRTYVYTIWWNILIVNDYSFADKAYMSSFIDKSIWRQHVCKSEKQGWKLGLLM